MRILSLWMAVPIFLGAPCLAILPPLYETLAEFQSLVNDKKLAARLNSGEAIVTISRSSTGFVVETNKHTLDVDVIYDPVEHPAPAQYHLVFKDAQPLKK